MFINNIVIKSASNAWVHRLFKQTQVYAVCISVVLHYIAQPSRLAFASTLVLEYNVGMSRSI